MNKDFQKFCAWSASFLAAMVSGKAMIVTLLGTVTVIATHLFARVDNVWQILVAWEGGGVALNDSPLSSFSTVDTGVAVLQVMAWLNSFVAFDQLFYAVGMYIQFECGMFACTFVLKTWKLLPFTFK